MSSNSGRGDKDSGMGHKRAFRFERRSDPFRKDRKSRPWLPWLIVAMVLTILFVVTQLIML
jgi:hypothetical protein